MYMARLEASGLEAELKDAAAKLEVAPAVVSLVEAALMEVIHSCTKYS